jgi:hypothetical protein
MKNERGKGAQPPVRGDAAAERRERLIRSLEAQWKRAERQAIRAVKEAAEPKGLLGRLGYETATG